ncbi:MAG: UMP kinase [archaeon]
MKAVLKFGGSIFMPKEGADIDFIRELTSFLVTKIQEHEFAIVVGAGKFSRECGALGREFTHDEDRLDMIGIMGARLNASILIAALGDHACPEIPRSEEEFTLLSKKYPGKIVIAGGFRPRQRTDAVAVEIAKEWGANLVIKGTNVDYVYDKDPSEFKDAKPLKNIDYKKLQELGDGEHTTANAPTIMDAEAAKILIEEKIKIAIVNGKNLSNISKILSGESFKGTKIGF